MVRFLWEHITYPPLKEVEGPPWLRQFTLECSAKNLQPLTNADAVGSNPANVGFLSVRTRESHPGTCHELLTYDKLLLLSTTVF